MKTKQKKAITLILVLLFPLYGLMAQINFGSIRGQITNVENNNPVPFASVLLFQSNKQVQGASSDFDGKYEFKNLKPGEYLIKTSAIGLTTNINKNIKVLKEKSLL